MIKAFLSLFLGTFLMTTPSLAVQIIGHRGAAYDAPENTLSSFKLGYEQKADADELDIHLTKDGKVVVIHDFDTKRTSGVRGKVVDQTLEELRRQDIGKWGSMERQGLLRKNPAA